MKRTITIGLALSFVFAAASNGVGKGLEYQEQSPDDLVTINMTSNTNSTDDKGELTPDYAFIDRAYFPLILKRQFGELFWNKDYDVLLSELDKALRTESRDWTVQNVSAYDAYQATFILKALVLELQEKWEDAAVLYVKAYGGLENDEFRWFRVRRAFRVGERQEAFKAACALLQENSVVSVDDALAPYADAQPDEKSGMPACFLPKYGKLDPKIAYVYRVRSQCIRVACPEYPGYIFKHRGKLRSVEVDHEAFARFLTFMEEEYKTFESKDDASDVKTEQYKEGMNYLRSLAKLPY